MNYVFLHNFYAFNAKLCDCMKSWILHTELVTLLSSVTTVTFFNMDPAYSVYIK